MKRRKSYMTRQSLWLDNITRDLLTSGTLAATSRIFSYGATSNPTTLTMPSRTVTITMMPSVRS